MLKYLVKNGLIGWSLVLLQACGGAADLVVGDFDMDIQEFSVDKQEVQPGEAFTVEFTTLSIPTYEVKLRVSSDTNVSQDDVEIAAMECNKQDDFPCVFSEDLKIRCHYTSDNRVDCTFEGDSIGNADLTPLFESLPQQRYIIFEACQLTNDKKCKKRTKSMTFN